MKTLEQLKGLASKCLDGRDFNRLAKFIPYNMIKDFGMEPNEEYNNEERWNSTVVEFTRENVLKQLEEDVRFGFEKALNESAKIGSFNKTVEEANNIRSRVLKYVDKIKQERACNIDLCMTFERYIEIADKDAERAMAFLKEAYPFNEETEVFIRKRYNMSIDVNPEEN